MTQASKKSRGWIGVDLDGTLASYDERYGTSMIGKPIDSMVFRIKHWLSAGVEVRIFTARASQAELIPPLQQWLKNLGLQDLVITNRKDYDLLTLWDDRVVQLECNTGRVLTPKEYIMLDISGWIGVELDGTLAHFDKTQDGFTIGRPVDKMRMRVQQWMMVDIDVRLFTAHASNPAMLPIIEKWLHDNRIEKMKITCEKDFGMSQYWDDRGVHVVTNKGDIVAQLDTLVPERKYP